MSLPNVCGSQNLEGGVYGVAALLAAMAALGPSRQAAFFGPTVDNGALRTWLDLQLAQPNLD